MERGAPPFDAVEAPRLHCSIQGKVSLEGTRMRDDFMTNAEKSAAVVAALRAWVADLELAR